MEKNLLIAFALMGVVIFGTQYFLPQPDAKPVKQETPKAAPAFVPAPVEVKAPAK